MSTSIDQIQWYQWVAGAVVTIIIIAAVAARINARLGRRYVLQLIEDRGATGANELIVLAHGYARGVKSMEGVRKAVREIKPDADIVLFDYNRHPFSNSNPFQIAEQMDDKIEDLQVARNYNRIVLVGFSMGALLVRKAYVYGCGSIADTLTAGGARAVSRPPREWVKQVRRFVLLAGMNRGWNPEHRAKYATSREKLIIHIGWLLAKFTHTGLLIRQTMRGEPFVANLRLQWLEVMRKLAAEGILRPRVIQLLGDRDDVVTKDDSRDVTVARDFIRVAVNNTSHAEMVQLGDSGTALERKRKIQLAFGNDESIDQLKRMNPAPALDEDPHVKTVVFVLHGIRDLGEWTSVFEGPLQKAYLENHPNGEKLCVHRASYGYFAMGPFLLWADRQKNVRWFMDEVTELTARFPNLHEIHFIGHSNGTYVLASALEKYNTLKIAHIVFAGSVVRRDYRWNELCGRVKQVRNYVGSSDLVVGLFPRLFEITPFNMLNRDIGSAGFTGFEDGTVRSMETQFVKGGHGAALVKENVPSIVDFIMHGKKTDPPSNILVQERPPALLLLSNACWLVWLLLLVLILLGAWKVPYAGEIVAHFLHWPAVTHDMPSLVWSSRGIYAVFLWLILKTI